MLGARNMIGIGVACASAGLIVGVITLTGMGLMMTDFVEMVSAGNVLVMLVLVVTEVTCGGALLMPAIAGGCRPGGLQRQQ